MSSQKGQEQSKQQQVQPIENAEVIAAAAPAKAIESYLNSSEEMSPEMKKNVQSKASYNQHLQQTPKNLQEVDGIKINEYRNLTDMIRFIPDVRRRIPRSDAATLNKLLTKYENNLYYSTLVLLPVSFFGFQNAFFLSRIGRIGTFIIAITSTTTLTIGNIVFFQQVWNEDAIMRMKAICEQYKPIVRDDENLNFMRFAKRQTSNNQNLLENEAVADRAYAAMKQEMNFRESPYKCIGYKQSDYELACRSLRMEIDSDFAKEVVEGEHEINRIKQRMQQNENNKQQQEQK